MPCQRKLVEQLILFYFFNFLVNKSGKNKVLFFLTACSVYWLITSCSSDKDNNQIGINKPTSTQFLKAVPEKSKNFSNWPKPGKDYKWIPLWMGDTKLTVPRASAAVVAVDGYIYVLGGAAGSGENKTIHSSVEFSRIQANGSLGLWKQTSPMITKRSFAEAVSANGYIYVLGGEKGYAGTDDLLNIIERAKILPDGSLGPWEIEPHVMNTSRRAPVASIYNDWIYVFGGYNGIFLKDIERSRVNPDGSLQEWIHEAEEAKNQRYIHSGIIYKNFVYLFGGHARSLERGTDTVEWTTINPGGKIDAWRSLPPMPTNRFGGDAILINNNIYVVGGQNTIQLSAVDRASILSNGTLGKWSQDTPLPSSRVGVALAEWNNVIYAIGGYNDNGEYLQEVSRTYYVSEKPLGIWTNDPELIAIASKTDEKLPLDADNHFQLGIQRYREKRYDEAIVDLQLGIKVDQKLAQPHNLLGLIYHTKKMFDKAIDQYKKAIQLVPTFVPAYFNMGNVYLEMKEIQKSENLYRESLRLAPGFFEAKIKLLQLLVETDRCKEAEPDLKSLSIKKPENDVIQSLKRHCETQAVSLHHPETS